MMHQVYEELLNAYVDLEVTPEEEKIIRGHMESCVECRNLYEQNRTLKETLRGLNETIPVPHDLDKKLITKLNVENKGRLAFKPSLGVAISLALLVIIALFAAVYLFIPSERNPLLNAVLQSYIDISDGKLQIAYKTENAGNLEVDLNKTGNIPFEFDVDDFSEMGYELKGALVEDLAKRRSLIFVYEGREPVGYYLLNGLESDFPVKAKKMRVKEKRTDFYLLQRKGYNMVMWEEEGKTCFMVSRIDSNELLSLAAESVED